MELYEQLQQRTGVAIVGPPGSGKSTIRRILKAALSQRGQSVAEYVLYPKAMSRRWLLGHIDPDTRHWSDGVISTVALQLAAHPHEMCSWAVCDGDVEPEWVEALNSVLDDNRLLTLPSGARVLLPRGAHFLFETHALHHASPATVSRLGIVLLSEEHSCAEEVLESWLRKAEFESELGKLALPLLHQTTKKCIEWFDKHKSDVTMKIYTVTMVNQILTQFEYVMENDASNVGISPEELVYLAIHRSVLGIIKESALDAFYTEISCVECVAGGGGGARTAGGQWAETLYVSARLAHCDLVLRAALARRAHILLIGPQACAKK
ncbi:PREDICTED: cytoplasmic dynein 2 heavy chain 1-like [Papilio polytes]|uniref:cytoplasmic dynein 2 heavy chain 1-like n=1 Tax=Papilio polytes TaxID=76194 RepID=UPI0006767FA8|nr:PREDICTED: cytoplasmic dynein 2 heavy chain 1-like [Papilio polytes]